MHWYYRARPEPDGLGGRPDTKIAENLYIVGDWVGKEGLLSSASVGSAKRASQLILNNSYYYT
jgi:hypothetical protein